MPGIQVWLDLRVSQVILHPSVSFSYVAISSQQLQLKVRASTARDPAQLLGLNLITLT